MKLLLVLLAATAFAQNEPSSKPCPAEEEQTGPPRLKRGKPGARKPADCDAPRTPIGAARQQPDQPPKPEPDEDTIPAKVLPGPLDRVRARAFEYTDALPNFICEQLIRRLQSGGLRGKFSLKDTVTVDVSYVDGEEEYKNAKRNGKLLKDYNEIQQTGSYSTGEYGTTLRDVLHPSTDAKFTFRKKDTIAGVETEIWDLVVEQANSHWKLTFGGQTIKPKYRGAIWIDPKEFMVMRIEMDALNLPATYPIDHAEMIIEYGPKKIGDKFYTLPNSTASLACHRGSATCVKNEIEFRNYRKFSTESTISTTESTVTFDEAKKPPF
ncbi:MAG: hypothetical protein JST93_27680 [Acidobacteria bacterium]|nr:hypothetical protein [Acidobacteriota bacterium]